MPTTHEAGDRLGIDSRSVVKAILRKQIKAEKRGRDYWIEEEEIERYQRERAPRQQTRTIKATIRNGAALLLTHVYPEGTADLGSGVATVEGIGHSRLIKVPQADGSEIRILVVV